MLDILLFPFRLLWDVISFLWDLLWGLLSLVFGLVEGAVSLALGLFTLAVVVALITLCVKRREEYKRRHAENEDFISYYDKDAVK